MWVQSLCSLVTYNDSLKMPLAADICNFGRRCFCASFISLYIVYTSENYCSLFTWIFWCTCNRYMIPLPPVKNARRSSCKHWETMHILYTTYLLYKIEDIFLVHITLELRLICMWAYCSEAYMCSGLSCSCCSLIQHNVAESHWTQTVVVYGLLTGSVVPTVHIAVCCMFG